MATGADWGGAIYQLSTVCYRTSEDTTQRKVVKIKTSKTNLSHKLRHSRCQKASGDLRVTYTVLI